MKTIIILTTLLHSIIVQPVFSQQPYALVLHGGAGVMSRNEMSPGKQAEYVNTLDKALQHGDELLKQGATSIETVVEVIKILENSPLFNAGKGAVFNSSGNIELDASIMEGRTLNAGAVAGVTDIKNPIIAARKVMENSPHVFLSGRGASDFARNQGVEMVENSYFFTPARLESLRQLQEQERKPVSSDTTGTVGCVALDIYGNLCAGTSTGGMTNKKYGRIGDSPIIGAGNYANNLTCAVSCTGHGEFFIRLCFAHDVSALMKYKGLNVVQACREEIMKLEKLGGTGGVIALDSVGNIAMEFNTDGMFRGYKKSTGEKEIAIFAND